MQELRYTLLADGSSDRALLPILTWLLRQSCGAIPIEAELPTCVAYHILPRNFLSAFTGASNCILAICSLCIGTRRVPQSKSARQKFVKP